MQKVLLIRKFGYITASLRKKEKYVLCPYFVNPEWFKCGSNLIHKEYSDSCLGERSFMCDSCGRSIWPGIRGPDAKASNAKEKCLNFIHLAVGSHGRLLSK